MEQILLSAKQLGNVYGVQRLVEAIQMRPQNYTLKVLDIVLHHIRFGLPNPALPFRYGKGYIAMSDSVRCAAICAYEALYLISHMSRMVNLWEPTARILSLHLDEILYCIKFLQRYSDPFKQTAGQSILNPARVCVFLIDFASSSPIVIEKALMTSDYTIDIALGAWAARDAEGYPYIITGIGRQPCSLTRLLTDVIRYSQDSRQRVFDILTGASRTSRFLRKRIIANALMRYEEKVTADRRVLEHIMRQRQAMMPERETSSAGGSDKVSALDTWLYYLDGLTALVEELCRDPMLAREIIAAGALNAGCEALCHWITTQSSRDSVEDLEDRLVGYRVLGAMQDVVQQWTRLDRKFCIGAHLTLVDSGLFPVLVEGLQTVPLRDTETSRMLMRSMNHLKDVCCSSPPAAAVMMQPLVEMRGTKFWATDFVRRTGYEKGWQSLCRYIRAGASLSSQKQTQLCDNFNCFKIPVAIEEPKTCAGCHTMVYCSKSCQAADWNTNHEHECSAARNADEEGRFSGNAHYRQALRLAHATFLNRLANIIFREGDLDKDLLRIPNPMLRLEHRTDNRIISPEEYLATKNLVETIPDPSSRSGMTVALVQRHFLDQRTQRLVLDYAAHGKSKGLRLVEGDFMFGGRHISVLAMLQKTSICDPQEDRPSNQYTLRYCITRFRQTNS